MDANAATDQPLDKDAVEPPQPLDRRRREMHPERISVGDKVYERNDIAAEKLGDTFVLRVDDVHRERWSSDCERQGVVLLRDAREKARRVNAALSSKADEAARGLLLERRRHHVQWVVKRSDELLEPKRHPTLQTLDLRNPFAC